MFLHEERPAWPQMGGWETDPFDDGDPHYLPESELVAPYRVPGWTRRAAAAAAASREVE